MGVYRVLWLGAVGALAATGLAIAATSMSSAALISLSLCSVIVGPMLGAGLHAQAHPNRSTPFGYVLGFTISTILGAIAVSGLIAAVGALALLGGGAARRDLTAGSATAGAAQACSGALRSDTDQPGCGEPACAGAEVHVVERRGAVLAVANQLQRIAAHDISC